MQRRPYVPGTALTAAALVAGLAGCSGETAATSNDKNQPGSSNSTTNARPGKFRTLPEPCGSVGADTLRALLPGLDDQDEEAQEAVLEGQPAVTYDTDRRVGCRWKLTTPEGSRHLTLDFERIVSYDPGVGDDERAAAAYAKKAKAAKIPLVDATASPSSSQPSGTESASPNPDGTASPQTGTATTDDGVTTADADQPDIVRGTGEAPTTAPHGRADLADTTAWHLASARDTGQRGERTAVRVVASTDDPSAPTSATPSTGGTPPPGGSPSDAGPSDGGGEPGDDGEAPDLSPRQLDGLGDEAFLNDEFKNADSGVHRDITIVFRSSNVIVTIEYDQWSTDPQHLPDSAELQEKAQGLARKLPGRFGD
ncbi:DUF3558 domain-containing protein [Streptomyces sp. HSW2009]|uniref:DUF3558 domain-containing protein n=1 Tax=Streptomyces sp. HSW2009 TaxID=3142890 RepID=UPI0032EB42FC